MTFVEACRKAQSESQCYLLRQRKGEPGEFDAKPYGSGSKRGWFYLDTFTASAVCAVWDALNEKNRAMLEALPYRKAVNVCWKLVK